MPRIADQTDVAKVPAARYAHVVPTGDLVASTDKGSV